MTRQKKEKLTLQGAQLLARGDVIQIIDKEATLTCRVLSCLAAQGGGSYAALEVIEGERKGERIETTLRPGGPSASRSPDETPGS